MDGLEPSGQKVDVTSKRAHTQARVYTAERPFGCNVCGKAFKQKCHLAAHALLHTGKRPFVCRICGKDFKTGQTLMKTLLAPGLKARMLGLRGWYSTNILGNRDGEVVSLKLPCSIRGHG